MYLVDSRPLLNQNRLEIVNETIIYICTLMMFNFLNDNTPANISDYQGWILIAFAFLSLMINIVLSVYGQAVLLIYIAKDNWDKRKLQEKIKSRDNNSEQLKSAFPQMSGVLNKKFEIIEAI